MTYNMVYSDISCEVMKNDYLNDKNELEETTY